MGAWRVKKVHVITAWFKDFEESGYLEPFEEFYAESLDEAEQLRAKLLRTDEYESVWVSSEKQERELWVMNEV